MIWQAIAWIACIAMIAGSALAGWKMWLEEQPTCTKEEWEKVVRQVNVLTESMATVEQTATSLRSAIGMSSIGRKHG